jgi:CRP-like cAMP-binding protein
LIRGQPVGRVDHPIKHIYFVNQGLASIVKTMEDGRTVEVGAIGIEGATNALAFVGIDRALLDTVVQVPGTALRIGRDALKREIENNKAFRQLMQSYVRFAVSEVARHAACSRLHHLEQRCCRWLLIAHDSALSNEFPLTHESLAMMLGYQRAGVSIAMSLLVKAGLIENKRGTVRITNRPGLEASACECYGAMENELGEFLPRANIARACGPNQNEITRWR